MKLHKNTNQIFLGLGLLVIIDLLTKQLWAILLYVAAWSVLLFRRSNTSARKTGITSPVTGSVSSITKTKVNGEDVTNICINTMPVIDPQSFRGVNDKIISIYKQDSGTTLKYQSGISVAHEPFLGFAMVDINQGNMNSFFSTSENNEYGFSLFGCKTNIILPAKMYTNLIQGQKVIDGETIIGRDK